MVKAKEVWSDPELLLFQAKCNFVLLLVIAVLITCAEIVALSHGIDGTMWTGYIGAMCLIGGVITKTAFDHIIGKG